jgi:methylphosphotriester-DNA--protein-cysteine methyltransferase
MGYGPAFYRRIARLDRFSRLAAGAAPAIPLAQLAATAGYYDEAHLWRDCVALTGRTPARYRPAGGG